jgi:tRNA-2-methylthio-N6-dimethylallyladenosine synthase
LQGVREITLLGQIVTSYGRRDMPVKDGKSPFVQLLEAVHEVEGIERIRFTAPHPKGYGDDLVEAYGRLPKLVESAHIPMQSGSDRILKRMHRGYTVERCLEILRKLRQVRPSIGITTDLIVGFPGETDQDFEDTLALVRAAEFDNAFQYKYSPRQGTPAADMDGQMSRETKEARLAALLQEVDRIAAKRYEQMTGRMVEVLVEGPSRRNSARLTGRSRCNKIVVFEGDDRMIGQLLNMRVIRTGSFTLYGDPALMNLD